MKIKVKKIAYEKLAELKKAKRHRPLKPLLILRLLIKLLSSLNLWRLGFIYTEKNMETVKDKPCLVLMNHSSFIDFEIASHILFPKPFCIVSTSDGFVGMELLMRLIGCIPTKKFISDPPLVGDIRYALKEKNCSVLMYPEASYSFDGCATALPRRMGLLLKRLEVPVVMITTKGAFSRQPLYNCLKIRKVPLSAEVECILTAEEVRELSVDRLDEILDNAFSFDSFRWQQENNIKISEPFRAEGLERILFKCPHCLAEGNMSSTGAKITCNSCKKSYTLSPYGFLESEDGDGIFNHIPDWYSWQRNNIKKELEEDSYFLETKVKIYTLVNHKAIYDIGEGVLTHSKDGFLLKGCNGKLEFAVPPTASYGLYADYYWYEIGDIISIGDREQLFYCFPEPNVSVAKARMATEELYKLKRAERKAKRQS